MPYIFGKLWHLAIIWAIRKSLKSILQGVRFLLANHTRLSPTSENDSYRLRRVAPWCWMVYLVLMYLMLMYLVLDQNFGALGVLGAPEKEGRLLGVGNIDQSRRADRVLLSIFLRPLLSWDSLATRSFWTKFKIWPKLCLSLTELEIMYDLSY